MKMYLIRILVGLILLAVFFDYSAQAQAVASEPKRHEGEIWFEPAKMEARSRRWSRYF